MNETCTGKISADPVLSYEEVSDVATTRSQHWVKIRGRLWAESMDKTDNRVKGPKTFTTKLNLMTNKFILVPDTLWTSQQQRQGNRVKCLTLHQVLMSHHHPWHLQMTLNMWRSVVSGKLSAAPTHLNLAHKPVQTWYFFRLAEQQEDKRSRLDTIFLDHLRQA